MIDTHCHLDLLLKSSSLDEVLKCSNTGISKLIIPGLCPKQWPDIAKLCEDNHQLYFAVGLHPWWLQTYGVSATLEAEITAFLTHPKCVAIGECGLDSLIDTALDLQIQALQIHLELARKSGKPIILHSRKTDHQLLQQLKMYSLPGGGVLHGFSGHLHTAHQMIRQGLHIGIGGTITYPRARKTRHTVKELDLAHMVLETDAPDMPLFGFQGQKNSPAQLERVAQCLADLRHQPLEDVKYQTTKTAQQLFNLPE